MGKGPQDPNEQITVELAPGAALPLSTNGATEQVDVSASEFTEEEPLTAPAAEPDEEPPPPPPWGETDPEEWLQHEALVPYLTERDDGIREEARKSYYSQLQPLITQRNQQLQALSANAGRFIRDFEKASREGNLDQDLLDRYEDTAQKISGAYWHVGRFDGARALILELGNVIEDETLLDDFRPRIDALEAGVEDPALFKDLLSRIGKKSDAKGSKDAEQKGYERGLAEGRKAATEEMKAQARAGRGPDLAPKTPGAGSVLTLDRYRTMSPDEQKKLPASVIDAMTAEIARANSYR